MPTSPLSLRELDDLPVIESVAIASDRHQLGEGPWWDAVRQRMLWVDITAKRIYSARIEGNQLDVETSLECKGLVSSVVRSRSGHWLATVDTDLKLLAPDGSHLASLTVIDGAGCSRFNDAAVDPVGRFIAGTMPLTSDQAPHHVLRLEPDYPDGMVVLDADVGASNGIAWSPDGGHLFHVDTRARSIWRRRYSLRTGDVGPRQIFAAFLDAVPDGIAMDARGYLWVALWGAGRVVCLDRRGCAVTQIDVAAPQPTSVAFVGEIPRVVITTATHGMTEANLAAHPDAGRLFIADLPAPGVPQASWDGRFPGWGPAGESNGTH